MTAAQVASSSMSATSGPPRRLAENIRIGMATGALNGTHDSTVSTVALSLKKITRSTGSSSASPPGSARR